MEGVTMKNAIIGFFALAMLLLLPLTAYAAQNGRGQEIDCTADPTFINGIVYSGDASSPPVPGIMVDVTCLGNTLSDETDSNGWYNALFDPNSDPFYTCPLGSNVTACVGDKCNWGIVQDCLDNQINIVGIDIFNIPEFGLLAGGIAVIGAVGGFFLLRRRD